MLYAKHNFRYLYINIIITFKNKYNVELVFLLSKIKLVPIFGGLNIT